MSPWRCGILATALALLSSCGDNPTEPPPDADDEGTPLPTEAFADSSLETAVRQALALYAGPLTPEKLGWLISLSARDREISVLTGIEALHGLRTLDLAGNQIVDLGPLAALDTLQLLDLSRNKVSDLTPLTGLPRLQVMVAADNQIADPSPLLSLPSLAEVDLTGNPLSAAGRQQVLELRTQGVRVSF
ncbi:MAG: leucine-rich repeat domain-containing protein [Candidatus Latescibacterota bacterium]|jgi:Leucine-rich repeat (LRR) protein